MIEARGPPKTTRPTADTTSIIILLILFLLINAVLTSSFVCTAVVI